MPLPLETGPAEAEADAEAETEEEELESEPSEDAAVVVGAAVSPPDEESVGVAVADPVLVRQVDAPS